MTEKQFKKVGNNYYENIRTIGNLKEVIKNLDDDLPIECSVHKLDNTYIIKEAYCCVNMAEEPILNLEIKTDWDLTERDEIAFKNWCKLQDEQLFKNGDGKNG